jgi:hypothetical protein
MSDDTETTFPSTTFAGSFNGCASIGADFSGDLKFKVSDVPNVLRDVHCLGSGPFDITIVSRQGQLAGDSVDRDWANMDLRADEEVEVTYAAVCIGGPCPHFAVHGSGDLAGSYVCGLDPDALMVVVHGETRCPLYPQAETVGNADDDGVDELPIEGTTGEVTSDAEPGGSIYPPPGYDVPAAMGPRPEPNVSVVNVWYPEEKHARITDVGEHTLYGEFVADYLATLPVKDAHKDDALDLYRVVDNVLTARSLIEVVDPAEYGSSFWVEAIATDEAPAA